MSCANNNAAISWKDVVKSAAEVKLAHILYTERTKSNNIDNNRNECIYTSVKRVDMGAKGDCCVTVQKPEQ